MKRLFEMDEKQRAKWARARAHGRWHFVLLYGVAFWGGFMALATSVFRPEALKITAPVYLIGGFFFGLACWSVGEAMYRKGSGSAPPSGPLAKGQ